MSRVILAISLLVTISLGASVHAAQVDRALKRWMDKQPAITKITVLGNRHFSDGDIKGRLYSKTSNFWLALKKERRIRLRRETASRDSMEVTYLYLTAGYLDMKVQTSYLPRLPDSSVEVQVVIDEGPQYRFGPVSVTGEYPARFKNDLEKIARHLEQGKPANPFVLRQAEFDMKTVLANNGYPYAVVTHHLDSTTSAGLSPVAFTVMSDSLVHYGQIRVQGLMDYPEGFARRELKIKPGAVYKRDDIVRSQQRLYESGYFSTLTLTMDPASTDSLRPNFLVKLRERKPMYATVQTGAAQSNVRDLLWDFALLFGKRNFLGSRTLELSSAYQFAVGRDSRLLNHRYQVRYVEPWLLHIRMPLELIGEVRPKVKSATQDYQISSWTVSASTTRKFGQISTGRFGIEYQSVNITGISPSLAQLQKDEGVSGRRRFTLDFRRDSRLNVFLPSQGSVFDYSGQYVGGILGGDVQFAKMESSFSPYKIVWPGWIAASRLKFGWAGPFGGGPSVPLEDRFYLGGANTIRGFSENSLGPRTQDGKAEGALTYLIANQEFRWRTVQLLAALPLAGSLFRQFPLWQSVFFDMGNGFRNWGELKFEALAFSYGTGVQIVTPAGPIRVDYGRRIATARYPRGGRWHFTILYAF